MRSLRRRVLAAILLVASLVSAFYFPAGAYGGELAGSQELKYDYSSLAIESILATGREAAKVPDIEQRVHFLISAAQLLPASRHDDAIGFLKIALRDLKEWASDKNAKWRTRYDAATLRSAVLSVYAKLDPDKAIALQKEAEPQADLGQNGLARASLNDSSWIHNAVDAQRFADATASLALTLIDTDFERALTLVVQSMAAGVVSTSVCSIFVKLEQNRNRVALDKLEAAMLPVLGTAVILDPFSLAYASYLTAIDRDMSTATRAGFIGCLLNSLEIWVAMVTGQDGNGGVDPSYVNSYFTKLLTNVRPLIAQYAPQDLLRVDILFDQVSPFVSEHTKSMLQAFKPEPSTDPRERLTDILRDPNSERRDLRLISLVSDLLRKAEKDDGQKTFDLASEAIGNFSDPTFKAVFSDSLAITRLNGFVKLRKFPEAEHVADLISSKETRVWTLLAISAAAFKDDRVLAFEFVSSALKVLDAASPSPAKVDLALTAAAMLAKDNPQRAIDVLLVAAKYATSSVAKAPESNNSPARGLKIEAKIGNMSTILATWPETLSEIKIDSSLAALGTTDWFLADNIASAFPEPALRLRMKLLFAEGVLAKESKATKATAQKPTTK